MLVEKAKEEIQAFRSAHVTLISPRTNILQVARSWEKPPSGCYKVNWKEVLDKPEGEIGFVAIVRDFEGQVIGIFRTCRVLPASAFLA